MTLKVKLFKKLYIEDKRIISFYLTTEEILKFKKYCQHNEISASSLMDAILKDFNDSNEK